MNKTGKGGFAATDPVIVNRICEDFQKGMSPAEIARCESICLGTVKKYLKQANLYTPNSLFNSGVYQANYRFFSSLANEGSSYWLGFISADGCVRTTKKGHLLQIAISPKDIKHLEKFKQTVEATHPIKTTLHKCKGKTHLLSSITIHSIEMVKDLIAIGIKPRKSYEDFPLPAVPAELMQHFVRGYFDGDGSWYLQKGRYPAFSVVGQTEFIRQLQQVLTKECDLSANQLHPTKKPYTKRFRYTGGKQCQRLFNYMYDNATIYMARKREVVEGYWS